MPSGHAHPAVGPEKSADPAEARWRRQPPRPRRISSRLPDGGGHGLVVQALAAGGGIASVQDGPTIHVSPLAPRAVRLTSDCGRTSVLKGVTAAGGGRRHRIGRGNGCGGSPLRHCPSCYGRCWSGGQGGDHEESLLEAAMALREPRVACPAQARGGRCPWAKSDSDSEVHRNTWWAGARVARAGPPTRIAVEPHIPLRGRG